MLIAPLSLGAIWSSAAFGHEVATNAAPFDAAEPATQVPERREFSGFDPNIALLINIPAFRLTLLQNGGEIAAYPVGIAQRKFPILCGPRKIEQMVWNPPWIPPDSRWVFESRRDVQPGEFVRAGDPRNPLGKIKLPLGNGYLIHQASRTSDRGRMVSHGCIRMRMADLEDLSNKMVSACAPEVSRDKIEHAKKSTKALYVPLVFTVHVDIVYETMEVKDGILRLYPDVYGHGSNTIDNLRQKLIASGIDPMLLDSVVLEALLSRVTQSNAFAIAVQDVVEGRGLSNGWHEPLNSRAM